MLKLKNILLAAFMMCVAHLSLAQKGTQTPYSSFGLGEINYDGYAAFSSMGGVALGNTDSTMVNTVNPASYAFFGRHMPVFQLGLNGRISTFSTETSSSNQRHFGLNQFQLGLPIKKNWGAAIGIKPYSFTGYTITKYTVEEEDTTGLSVNEGSGGIRIANLGLAFRPLNKSVLDSVDVGRRDTTGTRNMFVKGQKVSMLSIGLNGNYLFGTTETIRSKEFIPSTASTFNARVVDGLRVSGLTLELGLNYQMGFKSAPYSRMVSFGLTYAPAMQVRAYQDLYAVSYVGSFYRGQNVAVLDTTELVLDNKGSILKPEAYGFGFEYRLSPFKSNSLIRIAADARLEKWSTFYTRFANEEVSGGLKDRLSLGVGIEWIPKTGSTSFDQTTSFLSKIRYRIGFNYTQTELLVKNNLGADVAIDNYGMSFGLGIPILNGNSNTNLNFGASFGNLGTTKNGLIQERYTGIYVGFSITPQASDRWFLKRKYN